MKVGILGGTFNPVHRGHLLMAEGVCRALGLERVLWIPAKLPPHKLVEGNIPAEDRCRMVELAIGGMPQFQLSRIELDRAGPSYTVETLRQLRREQHGVAWHWLIGSDMLPELPSWRQIDEALTLATFVVVPRPSAPIVSLPAWLTRLDVPTVDASSSDIRQRIRAGQPIEHLVPEAVHRYILEHRLYR